MKIYDCVLNAATLLGLGETEDLLKAHRDDFDSAILQSDRNVVLLTECCNLVVNEVASEYSPVVKTCHARVQDNRLEYKNLDGNVIDILRIKHSGKNILFKEYYSYVYVAEDGLMTVEYSYAPSEGGLSGEIDYFGGRIGKRTLAYGIAAEYCIVGGRADEASLWDKRYKDSLFNLSGLKREARLPQKRWI